MTELNSKTRKQLEKAAHNLFANVIIGGAGVTPGIEEKVCAELKAHELIKVKFNEYKDEKITLSESLAKKCDATLVRVIGNIAIFYKENEDPEKRVIKLK
jgi:RNA-binding protein